MGDRAAPLVSVCIPVYNGATYLREAVKSVVAQDLASLEIVIQDNASTDGTDAVCREFATVYPFVRVERNPATVSMPANWNLVVNRARGRYLVLLSCDDLLKPGFLRQCLEAFGRQDVDIVSTEHSYLRESGEQRRRFQLREGVYQDFDSLVMRLNPFSINFSLFSRDAVERLKRNGQLFAEPLIACDYDLWLRAGAGRLRVYFLGQTLGTYRWHAGNLSRNKRKINRHTMLALVRHRRLLKQRHPWIFRLTVARLLVRVVRNYVVYRQTDARAFRLGLAAVFR